MRLTLAALALIAPLTACQTTPVAPTESQAVATFGDLDQRTIYNRARQWFSEYFVDGESVVNYEDPEAGTIIGNGIAFVGTDPLGVIKYYVKYTLRVDTKDGKARVTTKSGEQYSISSQGKSPVNYSSEAHAAKVEAALAEPRAQLEAYIAGGAGDW